MPARRTLGARWEHGRHGGRQQLPDPFQEALIPRASLTYHSCPPLSLNGPTDADGRHGHKRGTDDRLGVTDRARQEERTERSRLRGPSTTMVDLQIKGHGSSRSFLF